MSKKRVIITSVSCVAAVAVVVSAVFGVSAAKKSKKSVDVYSVSLLNAGFSSDSLESEGTVTSDSAQSVYIDATQQIEEIYVEEGDTVAVGDKLMALDLTSLNLSIEVKKFTIEQDQYKLTNLQKELADLQKKKVGDKKDDSTATSEAAGSVSIGQGQTAPLVLCSTVPARADLSAITDAAEGTGSSADPYIFLCEDDTTVSGALLNALKSGGYYAYFKVYDDGTTSGNLEKSLFVKGADLADYEEDAIVSIFLFENTDSADDSGEDDDDIDSGDVDDGNADNSDIDVTPEIDPNDYYTAEELAKALRDKQQEVAEADLTLRQDQLALEQMQEEAEDGIVYAKINGIVKTVHKADDIPTDGSAFLSVLGSDGMYIRGGIDELHLDQIEIGTAVSAYDYQSGAYMEGTIASIDNYPSTDVYCYSSENPNSSTYAYTAYFEDVDQLTVGQWVDMTIVQDDSDNYDSIYIDKAYVRKDDSGKHYVYKEDTSTGKLVKQEVTTGSYLWGEYVEIREGITQDDYIAFPYGDAEEGIKCNESEDIDYGDGGLG